MGEVKEQKQAKPLMEEILKAYIKNKNGAIFNVLKHKNKPGVALLRSRNNYYEKSIRELKQGLVDGEWFSINEHEYRKWVKKDNEFIEMLTKKMLKRILLAQLLIEVDDELIEFNEGNKYFRNLLEKSNKQAERIASEQYDNLYNSDKDILVNIINNLEQFAKDASVLDLEQFAQFNKVFEMYKTNPDQFDIQTLTFIKQR